MESTSFIKIKIENHELADICEKGKTKFVIEGDSVLLDLDLSGTWLDNTSVPYGGDFVDWFLSISDELGLIDKKTRERISNDRIKIEDGLEVSEVIYENCEPTNYSFNCHWEEIRTRDNTVLKGFDTKSWDRVWDTVDHNEIAKLVGNGSEVESLRPQEYPFWLFLSEGWAYPSAKNPFVRKMMDVYGTRVISKDMSYESPEYVYFSESTVDLNTIDLKGKTVCLHVVDLLPENDEEQYYYENNGTAFDIATVVIERHYGGKVTKSISGNTDYAVISNRMRTQECTDLGKLSEKYEHYSSYQKTLKDMVVSGNEKRLKKKKEAIGIIFEDAFYNWLHRQYDTLKTTHNYFKPYAELLIRLEPFGSRRVSSWKYKSEHIAQISQKQFEMFIDESNSIKELIAIIENHTHPGCFAQADRDQYERMIEFTQNDTFVNYEKVFINYEASDGNKYQIVIKRDPYTRGIQYRNSTKI